MKVPFVDLSAQWAPLKDDILKDWEDILDNASFVGGNYLARFEKELAEYTGKRFALGVSSGTSALTTVLRALGIGPGDVVGVQGETFIATAYAVKQVGAEVELIRGTLSNPDLKAMIIVHMYGEINHTHCRHTRSYCDAKGIYLIEDAAQALGNPGVGKYGIAATTSFYPAKNLGCAGQGGAILTNDEALYIQMNQYINQGGIGGGLHAPIGGNERLHTIQASILRHGLTQLDEWNAARQRIGTKYNKALLDLRNTYNYCNIKPVATGDDCVYHLYPVQLESPAARESLSAYLTSQKIANARHYPFAISQQAGFKTAGFDKLENRLESSLTLPMFPTMTDEQIHIVTAALKTWVATQYQK